MTTAAHDHDRPDTADMRAALATTRAILDGADHGTPTRPPRAGPARPAPRWPGSRSGSRWPPRWPGTRGSCPSRCARDARRGGRRRGRAPLLGQLTWSWPGAAVYDGLDCPRGVMRRAASSRIRALHEE